MRPCQPGPSALKRSSTSPSTRSEIAFFGRSAGGRPRLTSLPFSYWSASANHSRVNSGASSGSTQEFFVVGLFAVIRFPHRDYMAGSAALRPHHHHHASPQAANCDGSDFAIVETTVDPIVGSPCKHGCCLKEIQSTFVKRLVALLGIEADFHVLCIYKNRFIQERFSARAAFMLRRPWRRRTQAIHKMRPAQSWTPRKAPMNLLLLACSMPAAGGCAIAPGIAAPRRWTWRLVRLPMRTRLR